MHLIPQNERKKDRGHRKSKQRRCLTRRKEIHRKRNVSCVKVKISCVLAVSLAPKKNYFWKSEEWGGGGEEGTGCRPSNLWALRRKKDVFISFPGRENSPPFTKGYRPMTSVSK